MKNKNKASNKKKVSASNKVSRIGVQKKWFSKYEGIYVRRGELVYAFIPID